MLRTAVCDILSIEHPIIQAGMIREILPAEEIVHRIVAEAEEAFASLRRRDVLKD